MVTGAREVGTDLVLPEKGLLSEDLVGRLKAAGLRVATWVVDEPEELLALERYGLFAVGSNRPGALIEALDSPDPVKE
jgi:glycerophosphoryl diester phosphodiesterase